MKLMHFVPQISEEASGPSYTVPRLCQSLAALDHDVELCCSTAGATTIHPVTLTLRPHWQVLRRFSIAPGVVARLLDRAQVADVVHAHGAWTMGNIAAGWTVPGKRARLVISPRGTLSRWALSHKKWTKAALWRLQRRAFARADLIHATSGEEVDDIRRLGLRAPIALVANGIDIPALKSPPQGSTRTLLYLSRIHPKKGIERLLHAWQLLQDKHPDWRLEIVGRGEARYERELLDTCQALELRRVSMPGPKYGPEKSAAFFNAHLFVLPTHSENFGVAVAEALAHACPVVVSEGAPWSQLAANRCGWWTPNDVPNLADALHHAMTLPSDERVQMGLLGREWMARDFSWDIIARQMAECYSWILSGGDPPTCITTQSSTTALRA